MGFYILLYVSIHFLVKWEFVSGDVYTTADFQFTMGNRLTYPKHRVLFYLNGRGPLKADF